MNKIKTKVSRETNYIYHMLSVAKCGYDNEYGNKYRDKHSLSDLKTLKDNELLVTVKGGEHCGELYPCLISMPASFDTQAPIYYEAMKYLYETRNIEDAMKKYESIVNLIYDSIRQQFNADPFDFLQGFFDHFSQSDVIANAFVPICDVMIRNYSIYCFEIWQESEQELLPYAKNVEEIFRESLFSKNLEDVTNIKLKSEFFATFCNSLDGGAEAIDISANQDVFGINRSYINAVEFISHEYIIYLLKQALRDTVVFSNPIKYWAYIEGLAEFYLCLANGKESGIFKEVQKEIDFYKEIYNKNSSITPSELIHKAIESLAGIE